MASKSDFFSKHTYRAFGLVISSDICIPELIPGSGTADVSIVLDQVPVSISDPIGQSGTYQISRNELLFHVDGVGSYYVKGGEVIVVQPDERAAMETVILFILGTAFGAILLHRGLMPIHGSAVVIGGHCIILTGASGAGKSTLSSALRMMGYPFLADDISVVNFDRNGMPWVQPAYPQQKLCRSSMEILNIEAEGLRLIDADTDKYAVPDRKLYINYPVRLTAICELVPDDCCDVSMCELTGAEKLVVLMRNIYRVELLKYFGHKAAFLQNCMNAASSLMVYRMIRPLNGFSLEKQIGLLKGRVEELIKKAN